MKKSAVFSLLSFFALSGSAMAATPVVCGVFSGIDRTTVRTDYDVTIKLKKVRYGSLVNGRVKIGSAAQKASVVTTLYPTSKDNTMRAMTVYSQLVDSFSSLGGYLCISSPSSQKAIDSGFPYEFGQDLTLDKAVADLEKGLNF